MTQISHDHGMLATIAIETVKDEGGGELFLRGVAEPFDVATLSWHGDDVSYVLVATTTDNRSVHFSACDLVAVRTPGVL